MESVRGIERKLRIQYFSPGRLFWEDYNYIVIPALGESPARDKEIEGIDKEIEPIDKYRTWPPYVNSHELCRNHDMASI